MTNGRHLGRGVGRQFGWAGDGEIGAPGSRGLENGLGIATDGNGVEQAAVLGFNPHVAAQSYGVLEV